MNTLSVLALAMTAASAPAMARYLESDPIGQAAGPSTYSYVWNSPLGHSDPLGLKPGDLFRTPGQALWDADSWVRSQPHNQLYNEFGGWTYKKGNCYTYNATTSHDFDHVDRDLLLALRQTIRPATPLAGWHSHSMLPTPAPPNWNEFSGVPGGKDGDIPWAEEIGVPFYLLAPNHSIIGYNPHTEKQFGPIDYEKPIKETPVDCGCDQ